MYYFIIKKAFVSFVVKITFDIKMKTLFDKVWDAHVVDTVPNGPQIIYIDKHLIHEVTSPQAFAELESRNL